MDSHALLKSLTKVTKKWTKQRKQEERHSNARMRRTDAMIRSRQITIQEAAYAVMKEAYMKASAGGKLPAHARQIMYAARGEIQEMTGKTLNDQYFTQTLLPDYMRDHSHLTAGWDVVFDARGHFFEPHTKIEVPLGTLAVRDYLAHENESAYWNSNSVAVNETLYPTHGPCHRFGAVLFLEKEGFLPLLQAVHLAERYDIAIMSTKGMSSTAARHLVDRLCSRNVPLLIVRDFDKAGFSIAATLQNDNRRYQFRNAIQVHDLGLRLADVQNSNLESESVSYGYSDPQYNLRFNGATEAEIEFLSDQRVELNAFTSDQFVEWLEEKLTEHCITKVIPDSETLTLAFRRELKRQKMQTIIEEAEDRVNAEVNDAAIPDDLAERLSEQLEEYRELSWDSALTELMRDKDEGA
jgi:hypothetical protein